MRDVGGFSSARPSVPLWLNRSPWTGGTQSPRPILPALAPMITKEVSIFLPEAFEQAGKTSLTTLSQLHA